MRSIGTIPLIRTFAHVTVLAVIATFLTVSQPASPSTAATITTPTTSAARTTSAAKTSSLKKHKTLVVRAYWGSTRPSAASTTRAFAGADRWLRTVSHQRYALATTITPSYRVKSGCANVSKRGLEAARRHGYRLERYDILVVIASRCGSKYGEQARIDWVPRRDVMTFTTKAAPTAQLIVHEFGHLSGVDDSQVLSCQVGTTPLTISSARHCVDVPTVGDADVMGDPRSTGGYAAPTLDKLGWLGGGQKRTLTHGSTSLTLRPIGSSGLRAVRVRLSKDTSYWLEYRRRTGLDARMSPRAEGVIIRRVSKKVNAPWGALHAQAVDMLSHSWQLDALKPQMSWTSPEGVRIQVLSAGATGTSLTVRWHSKPSQPGAPTVRAVAGDGLIDLSWLRPADHGRPVQQYEFTQVDPEGKTVDRGRFDQEDPPRTRLVAKNGSRYVLRVRARNDIGWGPWARAEATAQARLPTVKIISPATGTVIEGRYVDLVIAAAPHPLVKTPVLLNVSSRRNNGPDAVLTRRSDGTWAARLDLLHPGDGEIPIYAHVDASGHSVEDKIVVRVPTRLSAPEFVIPAPHADWSSGDLTVTVKPGVDRPTGLDAPAVWITTFSGTHIATAVNHWTVTIPRSEAYYGSTGHQPITAIYAESIRNPELMESETVSLPINAS